MIRILSILAALLFTARAAFAALAVTLAPVVGPPTTLVTMSGAGKESSSVSNRRVQPRDFSPPMLPFTTSSMFNAI